MFFLTYIECSYVNLYPLFSLNLFTNARPITSDSNFAIIKGNLFLFFFYKELKSLRDNSFSSKFEIEFFIK